MRITYIFSILICLWMPSVAEEVQQDLIAKLRDHISVFYHALSASSFVSGSCIFTFIVPAESTNSAQLLHLLWNLETQVGDQIICLLLIPTHYDSAKLLENVIVNGWIRARAALAVPWKVLPIILYFPQAFYELSRDDVNQICSMRSHTYFLREGGRRVNKFNVFDPRNPSEDPVIEKRLAASCKSDFPLLTLLKDVALLYVLKDIPDSYYVCFSSLDVFYMPKFVHESIKCLEKWWRRVKLKENSSLMPLMNWTQSSIVLWDRIQDGGIEAAELKFSNINLSSAVIKTKFLRNFPDLTLLNSLPTKSISYHYHNVDDWFIMTAEALGAASYIAKKPISFY